MKRFAWLVLLLLMVSAAGCTYLKKPAPRPAARPTQEELYERVDAEALLEYGDKMASASVIERKQECERLLRLDSAKMTQGEQFRLFLVQLLHADCGDISRNLESLKARRSDIKDAGARRLFDFAEQIRSRLDDEIDQRKSVERQLRLTNQRVQSTNKQMKTRESEIKSLQDKLDALKSIEQDLGAPDAGQ